MEAFEQITEDDIRASVSRLDFNLQSMTRDEFADRLVGLMKGELMPKDVQGISDETMERIYALAYSAFSAGRIDDARTLFQFLCANDYLSGRYWLGLGACEYAEEDYASAVQAYAMACLTSPGDPRPRLRSADCLLALGQPSSAITALREAVELCGDAAEHASRRARAEKLLGVVEASLAELAEA